MKQYANLSFKEQALLFSIGINPSEIVILEPSGQRIYYLHFKYNELKEKKKVESSMEKLSLKFKFCTDITGTDTLFYNIYLLKFPKFFIGYLLKGQSMQMQDEVTTLNLLENQYILQ